jgi:hypothetical protein
MQFPLVVFQNGTRFVETKKPESRENGDKKQIPYKGPHKLHARVQNLVATAIWRPGFVLPCAK